MTIKKSRIKHFGVLSVAKIFAVFGAIWGIILGAMVALGIGTGASAMGLGGLGALGVGIIGFIVMIILGVIFGFIIGAVYAFIYNVVADAMGGIEMELDVSE
jgi:hypothetical protein